MDDQRLPHEGHRGDDLMHSPAPRPARARVYAVDTAVRRRGRINALELRGQMNACSYLTLNLACIIAGRPKKSIGCGSRIPVTSVKQ